MTDQLDTIPGTNGSAQLFAKMARVMGKMSRLKKTGRHPSQGYPFATDADVSDLVREAMAEEGIAFLPSMTGVNPVQIGETKYQSPIFRNYASFVFTFACADTGATYSCSWQSEADDSSDKGINKTATAAVKYFLLKTFLISTGDTIDPDASADVEHAKPKAANKPANGAHPPPPAERPTAPPSTNGTHGSDGKTIEFPGKPATPKNAAPAADGEHQPAMLLLNDLIDSPDMRALVEQKQHRQRLVNLLAKNGLFADCETTPDMLAIVTMYGSERAVGTDKEKSPDEAVAAVKRTLATKQPALERFPAPEGARDIPF